ncbi:hypothetical protein [Sunxiuqinia elliptica]|uniref:Uncharacterized protein n=1 Tax=Sunxiuqinia elliptica TaxID=655355 RepID=A0A1I2LFW7_9BACT|nr:hypothetical protein [Sunxiuqinia elliptica]SFF78185.1 hypothetical protein SAMN05216283_1162 [Sunxiuqinia elliptica]
MNNKIKKYKQDTAFIILFVIGCYTVITSLIKGMPLSWHGYAGLGSIAFSTFLYFTRYGFFKYFFVIVLFLGLANVLHFTTSMVTISFYVGILKVINLQTLEVQVLSFLLLLVHGFFHRKSIFKVLRGLSLKSEEEKLEEEKKRIEMFEKQFKELPRTELEVMKDNKDSYSKEAILAIENLLKE